MTPQLSVAEMARSIGVLEAEPMLDEFGRSTARLGCGGTEEPCSAGESLLELARRHPGLLLRDRP
jgi:hypothetical protein